MVTVILDNGHGKETHGKRSPKGMLSEGTSLYEYEFNRDVVCRLKILLDADGVSYHDLVPEIEDVSLRDRGIRANELIAKNPEVNYFLVSIHANAGGGTGWEVFHYPNSKKGKEYSTVFNEWAKSELPEFRNRGVKSANFAMLRYPKCPAVLTENLFMDTEEDLAFIISDDGRQRIAELHAKAIREIISTFE